jgi:two-component system response regulator FixJ
MVEETSKRVFVVDDNEFVRDALKTLLRSAGYDVQTFESAEAFLDHDAEKLTGLLILDIRMPGMSGLELQKRLADAGRNLPIIFITAHEGGKVRKAALEEGAEAFLQKPFEDETLLGAVQRVIG